MSPTRPTTSRLVDGPNSGGTMYQPSPTPQCPSVCPKSSSCFSRPTIVAGSSRPARPKVVFNTKRVRSRPDCKFGLQRVVDDDCWIKQVVEEVADADP